MADLRWQWRADEAGETHRDRQAWTDAFVQWLHDHSDSHLGVVALDDQRLIGEGWLAFVDRVPTVATTDGAAVGLRRSGYLQAVYVAPDHRDSGVGSQIVDLLVAEARAADLSYLSVHPSERSFPLYRRAGFSETDRVLQLRF